MSDFDTSPLRDTRLASCDKRLRDSVLNAALQEWQAADLLGDARLEKTTSELRQRTLDAARTAWSSQDALRDRILAAAETTWKRVPYETSGGIRLLSDDEWAIEATNNTSRRRTLIASIVIPAAAALLILGVSIAGGAFSPERAGPAVAPSSIAVITEQQPMLGVVARSVRKGSWFKDDTVDDTVDHYDEWLDRDNDDRQRRPRQRSKP